MKSKNKDQKHLEVLKVSNILLWIKSYWKSILISIILLIVGILTLSLEDKKKKIKEILDIAKDSHEKQKQIEEQNRKEIERQTEEIKRQEKKEKEELQRQKVKEENKIKEKIKKDNESYQKNPEKLTKDIAEEYNLETE